MVGRWERQEPAWSEKRDEGEKNGRQMTLEGSSAVKGNRDMGRVQRRCMESERSV